MRLAVSLAFAIGAGGCQVVFPIGEPADRFPHVPADREPAENERVLEISEFTLLNTTTMDRLGTIPLEQMRQQGADSDIVVMRVDTVHVTATGTLALAGRFPLVLIARTMLIEGAIDASASGSPDGNAPQTLPGPGGGAPDGMDGHPGLGAEGAKAQTIARATGGGGGGFGMDGADGGRISCPEELPGGRGGPAFGDASLTELIGGGAGGRGGRGCALRVALGGAGGGALQLSATESIEIGPNGALRASGEGGAGGSGSESCQGVDQAGSGGGAGGSIYVDAPQIENRGTIEAQGGGGGGGGGDRLTQTSGLDGKGGNPGSNFELPGHGGEGIAPKGLFGGDGAIGEEGPQAGAIGQCTTQVLFNTGGGGGAPGRIVIRGELGTFGRIAPPPLQIAHP